MPISGIEARRVLARLAAGQPPPPRWAADLLVGYDALLRQWKADLEGYIFGGGSLIRIVAAPVGSGKTHLARALQAHAAGNGFLVCQIDAQVQHTDDDLALYGAFCGGLRHPSTLMSNAEECGLLSVLLRAANQITGSGLRASLRRDKLPIATLGDALASLVDEVRLVSARRGSLDREKWDEIVALVELISGQPVMGTRSLAKIRRYYRSPILRRLSRTPGKRDARLWLESLLLAMRSLGFKGVLVVLDEHDTLTSGVLDRHIVQLRRTLDKLTEGHLPGVFTVYFVLDNFSARVAESHIALEQRLKPLLDGHVPNRLLTQMEEVRDVHDEEFLLTLGDRLFELVGNCPMPADLRQCCRTYAKESIRLGRVDTREFVMRLASEMLNRMD